MKNNHKQGRPPKITGNVLSKLEHAYSIGCSDSEACAYADVAPSTLYRYIKANPEFEERRTILKAKPVLKAKQKNMELLEEGDGVHVRWYLEHRAPDEFSTKQAIDISGGASLSIKDRSDALGEFLKRFSIE